MHVRRLISTVLATFMILIGLVGMAITSISVGVDDVTVSFKHAAIDADESQARSLTPRTSDPIEGTWNIVAEAKSTTSLKRFEVRIEAISEGLPQPGPSTKTTRTYGVGDKGSDKISSPWNTMAMTPYNGAYRLVAVATSHVDDTKQVTVENIIVNNAPRKPSGFAAKVNGDDIKLTWAPNTEPDLQGYVVLRSIGSLPFSQLAIASNNSYTDISPPKGVSLRYQLAAMRASVVSPAGTRSAPVEHSPLMISLAAGDVRQQAELQAVETKTTSLDEVPESVKARRDVGYNPTLPYDSTGSQPAADLVAAENAFSPLAASTDRTSKIRFVAMALLLFGMAIHMAIAREKLLAPSAA